MSNSMEKTQTILIFWTKFFQNLTKIQNRITEHYHRIQHICVNLGTKFHLNQRTFSFLNQTWVFSQGIKKFASKSKNLNTTIKVRMFEEVKAPSFIIRRHFYNLTKFVQKWYFRSTATQMNITIEFNISELVQAPSLIFYKLI